MVKQLTLQQFNKRSRDNDDSFQTDDEMIFALNDTKLDGETEDKILNKIMSNGIISAPVYDTVGMPYAGKGMTFSQTKLDKDLAEQGNELQRLSR